ncbi:hypothetical protein V476_20600 [Pseudomonas syringae KCTC 12500]|nr:hypothetical protein V476_20600 [Pseudomonas syringae KCTC 12500]POR85766.1 hypothetical protein BKM21_08610 [Pseudomonas syringae pv. syringae]
MPLPEGWQDDVVLRISAIDEVIRRQTLALIGEAVKQPDLSAEETSTIIRCLMHKPLVDLCIEADIVP